MAAVRKGNFVHKFAVAFLKYATFGGVPRVTNPGSANAFHGITNVSSRLGGYSATISTTNVKSDSYIWWGLQSPTGATSAHVPFTFVVGTKSDGGFFTLTSAGSHANVGSFQVFWRIEQPV